MLSAINNSLHIVFIMSISSSNTPDNLFKTIPTDEDFIKWAKNDCNVSKMREALRLRPDLVNKINVRRML